MVYSQAPTSVCLLHDLYSGLCSLSRIVIILIDVIQFVLYLVVTPSCIRQSTSLQSMLGNIIFGNDQAKNPHTHIYPKTYRHIFIEALPPPFHIHLSQALMTQSSSTI